MEVEPQPLGRDERAGLFGVPAEHFAQGVVHQVRGGVVAADRGAARDVGLRCEDIADADSPADDFADVEDHPFGTLLHDFFLYSITYEMTNV